MVLLPGTLCPVCVLSPDVPCLCRPALRAAWQVQRGQPVQPAPCGVLHRHPGAAALRLQVRAALGTPAAFSTLILPCFPHALEYLASLKVVYWGESLLCFTVIKYSQFSAPLHKQCLQHPELPGRVSVASRAPWLWLDPVPHTQTGLLSCKHWFNCENIAAVLAKLVWIQWI